jgi:hypothetical protein
MKINRRFVVVDGDNNISWSAKKDAGEAFATFKAAHKRAEEIAKAEPGTKVLICEAHTAVSVGLIPVVAKRLK